METEVMYLIINNNGEFLEYLGEDEHGSYQESWTYEWQLAYQYQCKFYAEVDKNNLNNNGELSIIKMTVTFEVDRL